MNLIELMESEKRSKQVEVIEASKDASKVVDTIQAARGVLFFHKKRGTTVAIVKPNVGTSESGDKIHLVVESRTGNRFRALENNLQRPDSI